MIHLCMNCGCPSDKQVVKDWLIETRPTLGGGQIEIVLCFPCRNLVPTIDRETEYPDLPTVS